MVTPCTEVWFCGHSNFRSSKLHTTVPSVFCMLLPLSSLGLLVQVMLSHCMFSPASGPIFARVVASRPFQAHLGCPWHPICNSHAWQPVLVCSFTICCWYSLLSSRHTRTWPFTVSSSTGGHDSAIVTYKTKRKRPGMGRHSLCWLCAVSAALLSGGR